MKKGHYKRHTFFSVTHYTKEYLLQSSSSLSFITFPEYVVLHILSQLMLCLAKKHCLSFSSSNLSYVSVNTNVLYRAVTDHSLTVIYFKPAVRNHFLLLETIFIYICDCFSTAFS